MPSWLKGVIAVVLLLAWTTTALITGVDRKEPAGRPYELEVDNGFGLTKGADVKVAGVRAGLVEDLTLDQRTRRAIVALRLTQPGFDELHSDAFCQIRPQSVIGEYYLDCRPGSRGRGLPAGTRLPVTRSASAIGLDLLNSALRRPSNERLRILLGELGAGVAARGPDLNAALRRALPAVRETNRVLAQLATERRTLADLALNGDRALADLARQRRDVTRFVAAAGRTANASANQRQALGDQFERFPAFLTELVPSIRALGHASDRQATALSELSADAPQLKTVLRRVGTFSKASRPAVAALGDASTTGTRSAKLAKPVLAELLRSATGTPELARNLRFVFEHLDSQDNAVEPDPRSPGGKGFSGLQAILWYAFAQSTAINVYDKSSYLLKVSLRSDRVCGKYADAAAARAHPQCNAFIGPTQPGVNAPDPTAGALLTRSPRP